MKQQLVFTVIAQDKPGIVTTLAKVVKDNDGNWLDSRMSQLAGEFAGIVHVEIDLDKKKGLEEALTALSAQDIAITIRQAGSDIATGDYKLHEIEIFGNDRPGIVAEVSKLFSEKSINILEFDTDINDAPVTGGMLFHADAVIGVVKGTNLDELQDKLHDLADELSLDIEWTSRL
ncbi:MAG: glycine cleavage system protein R [Gammaproteobacteria bacterium]|nr:MAG: glycine cleavage system protein R [Gammaproteobacteria bacterium]